MACPLFDQHTHTMRSFDGREEIRAMTRAAVRAGLSGITITDHCDFGNGQPSLPDREDRVFLSVIDAHGEQTRLGDRLFVGAGVELGQALHEREAAEDLLSQLDRLDFVLASVHNVRDTPDFFDLQARGRVPMRELLTRYFDELLETARWGKFDSLAHITYPYRYHYADGVEVPPVREFTDRLREIFTILAENGKALEINVSGPCRYGSEGRTMPGLPELKLFRACGGEFVTIGTDAHEARHVGGALTIGVDLARAAGFDYQAVYHNRKPTMVPLV